MGVMKGWALEGLEGLLSKCLSSLLYSQFGEGGWIGDWDEWDG